MKDNPKVKVFSLMVNVTRLRQNHQLVKAKIAKELKRPMPCSISLQKLKRKRLRLKDEIAQSLAQIRAIETPAVGQRQSV